MGAQKTQAITLRLTDYRETSQILSVYSRDFGRISLLAKGSKRKRAHSQGTIDLFQLLELVFIEKSAAHLHLLTESRVLEEFPGLRRELTRGYAAFFVAELLLGLTEESDPNPALFDLAVTVLGMLGETKHPNVVLHAFEVRVLELIGLVPRLDGKGRVAAFEIMFATPAIRNLIREGKTYQILSVKQTGKNLGMQTMVDHIKKLLHDGVISQEEADIYQSRIE